MPSLLRRGVKPSSLSAGVFWSVRSLMVVSLCGALSALDSEPVPGSTLPLLIYSSGGILQWNLLGIATLERSLRSLRHFMLSWSTLQSMPTSPSKLHCDCGARCRRLLQTSLRYLYLMARMFLWAYALVGTRLCLMESKKPAARDSLMLRRRVKPSSLSAGVLWSACSSIAVPLCGALGNTLGSEPRSGPTPPLLCTHWRLRYGTPQSNRARGLP